VSGFGWPAWHEDALVALMLSFATMAAMQVPKYLPAPWDWVATGVGVLPLAAACVILVRAARWVRRTRAGERR
jgi:hypothetical protein